MGNFRELGILLGLFLLSGGIIATIVAPAGIYPLFMSDFGITKTLASASLSAVFLTWAILQIPSGFILDRYDNRLLLLIGSILFLTSTVTTLLVNNYVSFLVARMGIGIGVTFVFVGSINIIDFALSEDHKVLAVSVFVSSPPFGIAVALFTGSRIANQLGWRGALLTYMILSLLGLLLFLILFREKVETDINMSTSQFFSALSNPSVLLVSFTSLISYTIWTFLTSWMPTYGNEVIGLELVASGAASALIPLAGIVARPTGGWIAELLDGKLKLVIIPAFVLTFIFVILLSLVQSTIVYYLLLTLAGASVNVSVGLYVVYVNILSDPSTKGTSLSIMQTFSQIGNLMAPILGGWFISQLSWSVAFGFIAGLTIIGIISISVVRRPFK